MKTLVLLSALVLLAFQVQADSMQEADEATKTEEQPGEEDQDVSVSFEGLEGSALQVLGLKKPWQCRCKPSCGPNEYDTAFCVKGPHRQYKFCCR